MPNLSQTSQITVTLGHDRVLSLRDLFESWSIHVLRLRHDAIATPEEAPWGMHDFIAALYLRANSRLCLSRTCAADTRRSRGCG